VADESMQVIARAPRAAAVVAQPPA
jgi:hypothetical protein